MPLDPQVRRLLNTLALAGTSAQISVPQRREAFRGLMRLSETGARVADIARRALPGPAGPLTVRLYTPLHAAPGRLPGLVYLHGGGFVCGDLETHDALCRALCDATLCRLIAVDYRLAPEHPFPAGLDDAHAATVWVIDHAGEIGLDPARIAIAGDSAGATLAAAACHRIARTHPGALALQLLLCPILDAAADTASRHDFARGYLLESRALAEEMAYYLPPGQDPGHPFVSPLRAATCGGLPPACIHTAEFDLLRDEGLAYADRLRRAGIAVRHTCHPGMIHLFYALGRSVPYARVALRQIGADVAAALAPAALPASFQTA